MKKQMIKIETAKVTETVIAMCGTVSFMRQNVENPERLPVLSDANEKMLTANVWLGMSWLCDELGEWAQIKEIAGEGRPDGCMSLEMTLPDSYGPEQTTQLERAAVIAVSRRVAGWLVSLSDSTAGEDFLSDSSAMAGSIRDLCNRWWVGNKIRLTPHYY